MRAEGGFTMIEVLVAMAITAIGIVGVLALYISQTRASSFTRHSSEAAALAVDKLEELRTATPVAGSDGPLNAQGATTGSNLIYTRAWTVNTVPLSNGDYSELAVTVTWEEDGGNRTVTFRGSRN